MWRDAKWSEGETQRIDTVSHLWRKAPIAFFYGAKPRGVCLKPWELSEQWHYAFGRRLLTVTRRCRLSLFDLSRRSGVPYSTLHGYVTQGRRVPAYAVVRLSRALGVQVSELLDDLSDDVAK